MAAPGVDKTLREDRLAFFAAVEEGYQRAEAAVGGADERYFEIAGHVVRLRFAGPALIACIVPAIAHLETGPVPEPAFTISLFDTVSTGQPLPLMVDSLVQLLRFRWWEHLDNRREIKGYHGDRIRAVFHLGPDILSVLDTATNSGYYWVYDAAQIPYYEKGYPLTVLLNWWLGVQGYYFLHAASFGTPDGGVLLTGKGGSGKSTTTLACVNSDLRIVGDDYCVVDMSSPPHVYGLYNTSKLKGAADVERFAHYKRAISNLDRLADEKAMIFMHEHFPGKMMASLPLRAILIPRITGEPDTRLRPTPAAAALKALAPSTLFQLAGNGRDAFQAMVRLVREVPCYAIELGTNIDAIPGVIHDFIDRGP